MDIFLSILSGFLISGIVFGFSWLIYEHYDYKNDSKKFWTVSTILAIGFGVAVGLIALI